MARSGLLSKFYHLNSVWDHWKLVHHPGQNQVEIVILGKRLDFQTCPELDQDVVSLLFMFEIFTNTILKVHVLYYENFVKNNIAYL